MKNISEVLRLHLKLELSLRKSAILNRVSLGTASNYLKRFSELNISIDEFLALKELEQEELFYPKKVAIKNHNSSKVMPDYTYIHNELKRKRGTKVTMSLLYEEYKEANPNNYYGQTQFREYYAKFLNKINPSMKQVHLAGEKMFVDYSGLTIPIVNQKTGEIVKAQIFVAVLGASGYTYVHATYSQKQRDFIMSHVNAFEFFEGVPLVVVPDNLKSAIISNNKKGVVVNDSYAALARHYNIAIEPARPRKPKDKSKVEQGVQGIQRWILARFRHQTFFSVDELNDAISTLLDKYNQKVVKRFNKSRYEMFLELDKPFLQALPKIKYIYKEYKEAKVSHNYHIFLEGSEYSVPFKYLGKKVFVAYSNKSVTIYYKGVQIAFHPKLHFSGQTSTHKEHMPLNHQYQYEKINPARYLNWANNIGIFTLKWVKNEFNQVAHAPNAYRKLNAVLSLAKIYGKNELELALEYSLDNSISKTASIKSILDKKLYMKNSINKNQISLNTFNNHEYLHGNIYQ